jgi:TolA-binding protein
MLKRNQFRFNSVHVALLLALTALPVATASADTIWKNALKYDGIKIERVEGDDLVFISSSGNETRKKLADITRIAMDDEPALTAAEEAYDGKSYPAAIDGYRKAATASARPWVRQRAALRLIAAGEKANDFGAAAAGFATLATIDPGAAQKAKPAIPADASAATLRAAVTDVQNAAGATGITPEQQRVLLNFQVELLTAAHDTDGASAALKQLSALGGSAPSAPVPGQSSDDTATIARARAEEKLNEARVALAQKNYKHADEVLLAAGDGIAAPDQQDEALFMLAECKAGLAGDDPQALADAGIAYMRVFANFRKVDGAAHIPESLMKTAAIEEKLQKPDEALRIYNEVAGDYKGTPFARDAAEDAARISAAVKPKG